MTRSGWIGLVTVGALLMPLHASTAETQSAPQAQEAPQTEQMPDGQAMACGERKEVMRILREAYGEEHTAHGLANSGLLAELFVGPRGTWTIVATTPTGMSCMIGSGEGWQTTQVRDGAI
jgi:hypothetical protein